MSDPLKGMRRKIANGDIRVLRWPADEDCPVEKGQRFKVQAIEIEIETIQRKLVKGKPPEWHATYIRHEKERIALLRQSPPVHASHDRPEDVTVSMAERARRDGHYTTSRATAMPDEPESVGHDWKDEMAEKRRLKLKENRREVERERRERILHQRLGEFLKHADDDTHVEVMAQVARLVEPPDRAA